MEEVRALLHSDLFGPYPWTSSGSIVDDLVTGFTLENQTRVIYSPDFFEDRAEPTDYVVVHELAHQWVGDSLSVAAWQYIWLNEGFATYTGWLWDEHENRATADETFDNFAGIPADDSFWSLPIGDPGPKHLFDFPVYARSAMTLHALRTRIGDATFFELLREWVGRNVDGNVTTPEFRELAEEISDQSLGRFFQRWLFTPERPRGLGSIRDASKRVLGDGLSTRRMKRSTVGIE
jgi:aminopeptidase N